jgi:dTDP-4-amino-4,6-dideoxygalactose transaminase
VPDLPVVDDFIDALRRIDARRWYTNGGALSVEFEAALAALVAGTSGIAQHCVTTSSGTTALEVALLCLNLPPGSRVLVPAYTFPATANAVIRAGHVPVLGDICPQHWTLTPALAHAALERERIDAVLPVAVFGARLPVEAWDAFDAATGIPVIIDAAAALGAMEGGRRVIVAYSLHATKPLGIGEGGLIASTSAAFAASVRRMINHGFEGGEVTVAGTNARLSEYAAAIGLAQLARWPRVLERRRAIWNRYRERLAELSDVVLQDGADDHPPAVLTVKTSVPAEVVAASLAAESIETRRWYAPPLHLHRAYAGVPHAARAGAFPVTEHLARHAIGVPFHTQLTLDDVDRVVRTLERTLARRDETTPRRQRLAT